MIGAGAMGAMLGARFAGAGADAPIYDLDADYMAAMVADRLAVSEAAAAGQPGEFS